jgi:hypothetical protein
VSCCKAPLRSPRDSPQTPIADPADPERGMLRPRIAVQTANLRRLLESVNHEAFRPTGGGGLAVVMHHLLESEDGDARRLVGPIPTLPSRSIYNQSCRARGCLPGHTAVTGRIEPDDMEGVQMGKRHWLREVRALTMVLAVAAILCIAVGGISLAGSKGQTSASFSYGYSFKNGGWCIPNATKFAAYTAASTSSGAHTISCKATKVGSVGQYKVRLRQVRTALPDRTIATYAMPPDGVTRTKYVSGVDSRNNRKFHYDAAISSGFTTWGGTIFGTATVYWP